MINLLPLSEKKKLREEYWLRFAIVFLCLVFALEVFSATLFTPAYYALSLNVRDLTQALKETQALTPEGDRQTPQTFAAIKKEITLLKPSASVVDVPPSALLGEILTQKPQGIGLRSFSYIRTVSSVSMEFSGRALTQDDLLAFRRDVKTNSQVLDFKYTTSFITKKTDIDFSAIVTFK